MNMNSPVETIIIKSNVNIKFHSVFVSVGWKQARTNKFHYSLIDYFLL